MTEDAQRDDGGRFSQSYDSASVLASMEPDVLYTTTELADALGWSKRTTIRRLNELADAGAVEKKPVGARALVWMRRD